MTPKEQAIKKAYGNKYDILKDQIDENGWVEHCPGEEGHPNWRDLVKDEYELECIEGFPDQWRPASLRGIENNRGWISVEDRLPKEDGGYINYWVYCFGVICKTQFHEGRFAGGHEGITHWQPVVKPEAPLY